MTRDQRRRMIAELKENGVVAEYEVITDNKVASLHDYYIIEARIQRDLERRYEVREGGR